ncbi:ATP-binding cassette domain-containing protein [Brumicola pallidula]|uniref:Probable ATP-binding protein YheS n=1 Tax=Brumicola pallidula DSM 14239 = ACAM 615 TaxID=1121922 RepID=K6Y453_9ALTE|nr:ATP-binding cassette domain-containing protein [Glaciecola pallidula]GAC27574.1 ATP-binding cassette, sub-family F, member 3 [Glaciecola pallidula DSM 14239 = ACAM 615]
MIQIQNLSLQRGVKELIKQANVEIYPGHKAAVIGPNGCGKSTLFGLLRGEIQPDMGDCLVPKGWHIVSVAQETPGTDRSAIDYAIDGDARLRQLQTDLVKAEMSHNGDKIGHLHDLLAQTGAYDVEARASTILSGLGFKNEQLQLPVSHFSGGWRMRLNLAQALLCDSDLLLLDEPTNHLDLDAVIWLETWIQRYKGTLLLISHDKSFIDACVNNIVSFEQQNLISYSGNYSSYEHQRSERMRLQASEYEKQERKKAHLNSFITRFKAKASKAKQAQSRVKQLEKMQDILPVHQTSGFQFSFKPPEKLPNPLVRMEEVQVGYADNIILKQVKMNLAPGSRIGLLGKNGAGKSTFIKLLAGELQPLRGEYATSAGLTIGYFAQHQVELLHLESSAYEHVFRLDKTQTEQQVRDYLGGFGFQGNDALKAVAPMSGGEKARLVLALVVFQKPNLLLLDEPTNHLDMEMRHALTFALQAFEGAMVLVSHDRFLLSTVCDEFYLVDAGGVNVFDGDLDDYKKWLFSAAASNKTADKLTTASTNNVTTAIVQHSETSAQKANSDVDKKTRKRMEAHFRQTTKQFRDVISKEEKRMETCNQQLSKLETELSDASLYDAENKKRLNEVLSNQAGCKVELEAIELSWLDAQEQLEAASAEFEKSL